MSPTSKTRKTRFEDMDRAELESAKQYYQTQVSVVSAQIAGVKAKIKAEGRESGPTDCPALISQKANLGWILDKIDRLLRKYGSTVASSSESEKFMKMAKFMLEPGLYQHILDQSKELR
jgi:hypothetical protein